MGFKDEYGYIHEEGQLLGQGGQGRVLRAQTPDIAIKLISCGTTEDSEKYQKRLGALVRLPIPNGINISMPLSLIPPQKSGGQGLEMGYCMRLLDDMVSAENLLIPRGETEIPRWLENLNNKDPKFAQPLAYYASTGGAKRRLRILAKAAAILARLHGSGLYYGDISFNNIYFSKSFLENQEFEHLWFIDADNIYIDTGDNPGRIFTPNFGAPEIVQRRASCSTYTDCFSFAVMAFWILSLTHPFTSGAMAAEDSEVGWDDDTAEAGPSETAEDKALSGFFPWVDDKDDTRNSTLTGIPRNLLLTPELAALFQDTFSEEGRNNPLSRPQMGLWALELARASDKMQECSCGMAYYSQNPVCPYCGASRGVSVSFKSYTYQKNLKGPLLWEWTSLLSNAKNVPARILGQSSFGTWDTPIFSFVQSKRLNVLHKDLDFSINGKQFAPSSTRMTFDIPSTYFFLSRGSSPVLSEMTVG